MYATVLEALNLQPGQSMLTVGSGSGYFCALCSTILGPTGVCHGVEIRPDVVAHALACTQTFLNEHEIERKGQPELCASTFVVGDGFNLSPAHNMRYDRIYVAAGAESEDVEFFQQFLTLGGIMVGPFGETLLKVQRRTEEDFSSHEVIRVMFAPLDRSSMDSASPPQKRPRVLLAAPLWSPLTAHRFPSVFNQSAGALNVLQQRPASTGGVLSLLPPSLLFHILSFCARDWFVPEVPLVDYLLAQLRDEIKARKEAEAHALELQRERDEAMMLCMYLRAQLRNHSLEGRRAVEEGDSDDDDEEEQGGEPASVSVRPPADSAGSNDT